MKKIIVTGGSGFIGTNLVNYLIQKKFFVINIDKLTYASSKFDEKKRRIKNYKFFKVDINNQKSLLKIINKFKPVAIFNLAAETHVDRSIDGPKEFIKSNINGVFNLLEVLRLLKKKKRNIKLIHISTDEVYGDLNKGNLKSDEKFPYSPSSPYSASKASADHLIKSYVRTYKIPAIISNCCNNYGPYQFPEKLIPKMISNILHNKPLPVYAKGQNLREWIFVNDHCDALYNIFKKGKIGESYNVGTNENIQNIDMAKKLIRIAKLKNSNNKRIKLIYVKDRPGHDFRYALDSNKIKKKLNWKPKVSLQKGLKYTYEWYQDNLKYFSSVSKKLYDKRLGLRK